MTEQEYIYISNLGHIIDAVNCLSNVLPDESFEIDKKEYQKVMELLSKWRDASFEWVEKQGMEVEEEMELKSGIGIEMVNHNQLNKPVDVCYKCDSAICICAAS